jgi:hypothetical protein
MLFDISAPTDFCYGKGNILAGTRNDLVTNIPALTAIATADGADAATTQTLANALKLYINTNIVPTKQLSANQINSGESIKKSDLTTAVLANTNTTCPYTYCINLISLIGSLSNGTYLPLFALTSAPLRVEIQLVDSLAKAFCVTNNTADATIPLTVGATGLISNCEFIANMIELGDSAMSMVASSLEGQPLQFVVPDYRNFQFSYSLGTAQTQVTMPIPAKYSSLRSLFCCIRDKGTGVANYFPFSSVTCKNLDYIFRVGPNIYPPKAPTASYDTTNYQTSYSEHFSELMKAIGGLSDINHQPSIERTSYTLTNSVANTLALETYNASSTSSGSFYIGLDLENYAGADKSVCFAGWNSNTDDIYLIMNFAGQTAATTVRFDAYALFDTVVVCENNTAYVRF